MSDPKWLTIAESDLGLMEVPGPGSNPRIVKMYEDAGHPEVKDDATAWCSAAMNSWMVRAGIVGTGALTARSWMRWGKPVDWNKAMPKGTVVVFPRGKSAWQGHVAMVYADTGGPTIKVLGGNQSDSVSITTYKRSSIIAARWPNTAGNSTTMRAGAFGLVGSAGAETIDQITPLLQDAQGAALEVMPYVTAAKWILIAVSVASLLYAGWRYYQKLRPQPLPEIPNDAEPIDEAM